jgi:hypothetical protein
MMQSTNNTRFLSPKQIKNNALIREPTEDEDEDEDEELKNPLVQGDNNNEYPDSSIRNAVFERPHEANQYEMPLHLNGIRPIKRLDPLSLNTNHIIFDINAIIQFTRHAPSCNNGDQGASLAGKDFEPGLLMYGIIKLIDFMTKSQNKTPLSFHTYGSLYVFVSNLYRTWLTALLMHGTNKGYNSTLHIVVCPYLKEHHVVQVGNYPIQLNDAFYKFLKFLTMLHDVFINTDNEQFKIALFEHLKQDPTHTNNSEFYAEWYTSLPGTITFYLMPEDTTSSPYKVTIKKNSVEGKYYIVNEDDVCFVIPHDVLGGASSLKSSLLVTKKGYTEIGNLQKFMQWYINNLGFIQEFTGLSNGQLMNNTLSVVTHSHIMKDYIEATWEYKIPKDLNDENCWNFQVKHVADKNDKTKLVVYNKFEPTNGVLVLDGKGNPNQTLAIKIEQFMKKNKFSLCGKVGDVNSSQLCSMLKSSLPNKEEKKEEEEVIMIKAENVENVTENGNLTNPISISNTIPRVLGKVVNPTPKNERKVKKMGLSNTIKSGVSNTIKSGVSKFSSLFKKNSKDKANQPIKKQTVQLGGQKNKRKSIKKNKRTRRNKKI